MSDCRSSLLLINGKCVFNLYELLLFESHFNPFILRRVRYKIMCVICHGHFTNFSRLHGDNTFLIDVTIKLIPLKYQLLAVILFTYNNILSDCLHLINGVNLIRWLKIILRLEYILYFYFFQWYFGLKRVLECTWQETEVVKALKAYKTWPTPLGLCV